MIKNKNVKLTVNDDKTLSIQSALETNINISLEKVVYFQIYEDKITIYCYNNQNKTKEFDFPKSHFDLIKPYLKKDKNFIYCNKTWYGSYYINLQHIANATIVLSEYNRENKLFTLNFEKDGSDSIKKDYKHKIHIQLQFIRGGYVYMSGNVLKEALKASLTEKSQKILDFLSNIDDDVLQQL